MADSKLNFGIDETVEISSDEFLDNLSGNPDDVEGLTDEDKNKKKEEPKDKLKEKSEEDKSKTELDEKEKETSTELTDDQLFDNIKEEDPDDKNTDTDPDKTKEKDQQVADKVPVNTFSVIAKELFNQNIFYKLEDEEDITIETGQDLIDRFTEEKRRGAIEILEDILSKHGDDKREFFDAVVLKGVDPRDYATQYSAVEDLANLDLADPDNQERVMRAELRDQGWEKEEIDQEVEKIKSYGDLESASKRYHKAQLKRSETKLEKLTADRDATLAREEAMDKEYRTNLTKILNEKIKEKEFDGIPLTPQMAKEAMDFLYTKKWKLPSGEQITDFDYDIMKLKKPENHALKIKIGLIMQALKKDPKLSLIQKKAVSKESSTLFQELEKSSKKKEEPKTPEAKSWWT